MTENEGKKDSLEKMDLVLKETMNVNSNSVCTFQSLLGRNIICNYVLPLSPKNTCGIITCR